MSGSESITLDEYEQFIAGTANEATHARVSAALNNATSDLSVFLTGIRSDQRSPLRMSLQAAQLKHESLGVEKLPSKTMTGVFATSLDQYVAVQIPPVLRRQLGTDLCAIAGVESVCLYARSALEAFLESMFAAHTSTETQSKILAIRTEVVPVTLDKSGTIHIPASLADTMSIVPADDVIVLGVVDHVEIWNRRLWDKFVAEHGAMNVTSGLEARLGL